MPSRNMDYYDRLPLSSNNRDFFVSNITIDPTVICAINPPKSHDYPPGLFACPELFTTVNSTLFSSRIAEDKRWQYEMRREAQSILPFLYLGPPLALKNIDALKREGISLLIGIRSRRSALERLTVNGEKAGLRLRAQVHHFEVDSDQELVSVLPAIIRTINDHMCNCRTHTPPAHELRIFPKALIFCETGNEKAAAVAAAYLMAMLNYEPKRAMANIQARRLSVIFGESLKAMLKSFEDILSANRVVVASQKMPAPMDPMYPKTTTLLRRKRRSSFSDNAGDGRAPGDGPAGAGDSDDSHEWRQGVPPFKDDTD